MRETSSANRNIRDREGRKIYIKQQTTMSERSSFPSSKSSFRRMKSDFNSGSSLFRDSDPEDDSFFSDPIFPRSRLRSRLGESVFDSFPRRSTMRTFPSAFDSTRDPFGPRWNHPSWVDDELRRSRGSSPSDFRHSPTPPSNESGGASPGTNQQHSFFSHRKQDGGARGFRETSSQTSRASTPGSERSDSSRRSKGNSDMEEDSATPEPGVERHASVNSKVNAKASYSAQRQPKVHHIPIRVEPRDDPRSSKPSSPPMNGAAASSSSSTGFQHRTMSPPPCGEQSKPMTRSSPFASPSMQREPYAAPPSNNATYSARASREKTIPINVDGNTTSAPQKSPPQEPEEFKTYDIPMQTPTPSAPPAQPQPPAPPAQPQPPKTHPTPLEMIDMVLNGVEELRPSIQSFDGRRGDKDYLYLDEMLTRLLIRLDYIEPEGNSELRLARRAAIVKINELIHFMEDTVALKEGNPATAGEEADAETTESQAETENIGNGIQNMDYVPPLPEDAGQSTAADDVTIRSCNESQPAEITPKLNESAEPMLVEERDQNGENKSSEDSGIASSEETNLLSDDIENPTTNGAKSMFKLKDEPKKFKTVANVQLSDCDATVPSTSIIDGISETSEKQPN